MVETQTRLMTCEEFYQWQLDQDERYELVEGVPVPLRAMTGASNVHDVILVNCIGQLGTRFRGKTFRVASADTALRPSIRSWRRPDVTVDCAPPDGRSYEAGRPTVVIEVLSPSSLARDAGAKLADYFRLPSVRHYLIVRTEDRVVIHHARGDDGAIATRIIHDGPLLLHPPGISLSDCFPRPR